jgi:hypothetical protein
LYTDRPLNSLHNLPKHNVYSQRVTTTIESGSLHSRFGRESIEGTEGHGGWVGGGIKKEGNVMDKKGFFFAELKETRLSRWYVDVALESNYY